MIKSIIRKTIKYFWGINGLSLFIKKQKKQILKKFYTEKYTSDILINEMCLMGMKSGSTVFIHSAMTEFYNYDGTAEELIDKIIRVIGDEGTLMMPAYPKNKKRLYELAIRSNEVLFDVNNTPSGAGYLTEIFRKYNGVKRSINLQHSVCAYGKNAEYFTSEHHLSEVAWDEYSPYYKLSKMKVLIFSLGLEPYLRNVTMIHCIETLFRDKYKYYQSFFGKRITYNYFDISRTVKCHSILLPIKGGIRSKKIIKNYLDDTGFKRSKISNLSIEMVESDYMYKVLQELTDNGICIYSKPSAKDYCFNGILKEV